jgi:hypothetical protein
LKYHTDGWPAPEQRAFEVDWKDGLMAGIGPVTTNRIDLQRRAGARPGIVAPKNDLEIFCSLCVGRVYFRVQTRTLYFVDSPVLSVSDIVRQVFNGLKQSPRIHQLYMDEHGLLRAAMCIQLSAAQQKALFAALTLSGVHIFRSTLRGPSATAGSSVPTDIDRPDPGPQDSGIT